MSEIESRAVIVRPGKGQPEFVRCHIPEPVGHQVRVQVRASGLCRSQLNQIASAANAAGGPARLLGHEAVGIVESVGSDVHDFGVGDTVLLSWVPRIDSSARRPEGIRFIDSEIGEVHTPDIFTWADYALCDRAFVSPVDRLEDDYAVIGCALFTGAGAVKNTLAVGRGESVGIVGAGGVGLCAVSAARCIGAEQIVAVDIDDEKLRLATRFGATHTINSATEEAARIVAELTGGNGLDAVADCIGLPVTIHQSLQFLKRSLLGVSRGGRLAIVGVPGNDTRLDLRALQIHEREIRGSLGGSTIVGEDLPTYLRWIREGSFDLESTVTDRIRFEDLPEGLDNLARGRILGRATVSMSA